MERMDYPMVKFLTLYVNMTLLWEIVISLKRLTHDHDHCLYERTGSDCALLAL